ncbi:unnamed protein product, partial [Polarella glacialis]
LSCHEDVIRSSSSPAGAICHAGAVSQGQELAQEGFLGEQLEPLAPEAGDPRNTNLDSLHSGAQIAPLPPCGHFAKVRGLAECHAGKVELYSWSQSRDDERDSLGRQLPKEAEYKQVVVKRVLASRVHENRGLQANERRVHQESERRRSEDPLSEIGVYCYLSKQADAPEYVLRMHAVFNSGDDVWLLLDHADGGDLFNVVQGLKDKGSELMVKGRRWTWQLLQAVSYLHAHRIAHRDISVENLLLQGADVRLMDFGQAVRSSDLEGGQPLRYFIPAGKPYYRAPECYVPAQAEVEVLVPELALPGSVVLARPCAAGLSSSLCEVRLPLSLPEPGGRCSAETWGYEAQPADAFACGVCLFIFATGSPPWRQALLSDPHFAWVHGQGVVNLLRAWQKSPTPPSWQAEELAGFEQVLASLLCSEPSRRPALAESLQQPWFTSLAQLPGGQQQGAVAAPTTPRAGDFSIPKSALKPEKPTWESASADSTAARSLEEQHTSDSFSSCLYASGSDDWSNMVDCAGLVGDPYSMPEVCRSASLVASCPPPLPLLRSNKAAAAAVDLSIIPEYFSANTFLLAAAGDPYSFMSAAAGDPYSFDFVLAASSGVSAVEATQDLAADRFGDSDNNKDNKNNPFCCASGLKASPGSLAGVKEARVDSQPTPSATSPLLVHAATFPTAHLTHLKGTLGCQSENGFASTPNCCAATREPLASGQNAQKHPPSGATKPSGAPSVLPVKSSSRNWGHLLVRKAGADEAVLFPPSGAVGRGKVDLTPRTDKPRRRPIWTKSLSPVEP